MARLSPTYPPPTLARLLARRVDGIHGLSSKVIFCSSATIAKVNDSTGLHMLQYFFPQPDGSDL
jgi:hypothetical protein